MEIITADWETYYDKDYSLSKMTTEEYVNDDRFEAIMLGMRMPNGKRKVVTGTHAEIKYQLDTIDWSQYAVLCHNTMFDAAIFTWRFGIKPGLWLDTLSMARAMHGVKGNSLAALAKKYGLQDKQDVVHNMLGRRRDSLSPEEFRRYARYCLNDVSITWKLFHMLSEGWYNLTDMDNRGQYPKQELRLIDQLIRMYSEPVLRLNKERLEAHLAEVVARKEALLEKISVDKDELMSNKKFAEVLQSLGVSPPMKISPKTDKETFAFSKSDEGMKALLEHPNPEVQAVVAARIGVKSTLEETRTQRFIAMAERSATFPVPLRYSAARTHRLGGCLVAETEVLAYDPVEDVVKNKKIVDVMPDDLVWDGEEFVPHKGVVFMGFDEVITHDGITGTSDHRVFTAYGEKTLGEAARIGAKIEVGHHFSNDKLETARRVYKYKP